MNYARLISSLGFIIVIPPQYDVERPRLELRGQRENSLLTTNLSGSTSSCLRCFWWTGLAPWEFEFPFPCSLISTFLLRGHHHLVCLHSHSSFYLDIFQIHVIHLLWLCFSSFQFVSARLSSIYSIMLFHDGNLV